MTSIYNNQSSPVNQQPPLHIQMDTLAIDTIEPPPAKVTSNQSTLRTTLRQNIMKRLNQAVGQHTWGDQFEIPVHEDLKTGEITSLGLSLYNHDVVANQNFNQNHATQVSCGFTENLRQLADQWPPIEKAIFNHALALKDMAEADEYAPKGSGKHLQALKQIQARALPFDFGELTSKVGSNAYAALMSARTTEHQQEMLTRIQTADDLVMNCVQFVALTLHQEGILSLDALKQNQDFTQLLGLNTAIPYKEHATKLKPGDLVMVYTKDSHEFCHIAFFRSHASQKTTTKPPRVIELGGNSETSHVRKGQIQITNEFELYVKPLKTLLNRSI